MASLPLSIKFRNGITKYLLRQAMKGLLPRQNIFRSKMGFAIPINEWFRAELKHFLIDNILSSKSLTRGYFHPQSIKRIAADHFKHRENYGHQLWGLLMFELWHQEFMDK
jgi:asparagine synthase (glutamine-hydrolysing)